MYCLIVEDERQTREGLQQLIPWHSIGIDHVDCAVSGKDALQKMQERMPDLLLCDVRMPHMNGVELIRHLREMGNFIPVIFMSGFSDKEYLMAAIHYHAVEYIEKPLSVPILTQALAETVRKLDAAQAPSDPHLASRMVQPGTNVEEIRQRLQDIASPLCDADSYYAACLIQSANNPGLPLTQLSYLLENWGWPTLSDIESPLQRILIVSSFAGKPPDFDQLLTKLNQTGGGYSLAVSMSVSDLANLPNAMQQARKTATRIFFRGEGLLYRTLPRDARAAQAASDCQLRMVVCISEHREPLLLDHLRALEQVWREAEGIYPEDVFVMLQYLHDNLLNTLPHFQSQILADVEITQRWEDVMHGSSLDDVFHHLSAWLECLTSRYLSLLQYSPAIVRAIHHIADHYAEHLSADELSHIAFVSTSHLCYLFRQELHCTIKQYITDIRMEKARCLLCDPTVLLYEVSCRVGIEDASYFAKLFRKVEGMTPSAYRERNLL